MNPDDIFDKLSEQIFFIRHLALMEGVKDPILRTTITRRASQQFLQAYAFQHNFTYRCAPIKQDCDYEFQGSLVTIVHGSDFWWDTRCVNGPPESENKPPQSAFGIQWKSAFGKRAYGWTLVKGLRGPMVLGVTYDKKSQLWDGESSIDLSAVHRVQVTGKPPHPLRLRAALERAIRYHLGAELFPKYQPIRKP